MAALFVDNPLLALREALLSQKALFAAVAHAWMHGCLHLAYGDSAAEPRSATLPQPHPRPSAILVNARAYRGIFAHSQAIAYAEKANGERAAIFQAVGRDDEALTLREEAAARRASFENVAALVGLHAERGEIEAAERRYAESRSRYRGVSPFPLALLDFQLGLMWMNEDQLHNARRSFEAARRRVPAYAPAQGHLAEVEAQLGEMDSAVARLYSLAVSSDDPDYAAQLARILAKSGRDREAWHWRGLAAARFGELMANRPEAFADHAAEFWLAAGADPHKALRFAKMNMEVRNTPRARALLAQAVAANGPGRRSCGRNAPPKGYKISG